MLTDQLYEIAQLEEQEHMRNALMAQARREARRETRRAAKGRGLFGRIVRRR